MRDAGLGYFISRGKQFHDFIRSAPIGLRSVPALPKLPHFAACFCDTPPRPASGKTDAIMPLSALRRS